ncbi:MAG: YdiY family protein [Limisphaerales bacterium]
MLVALAVSGRAGDTNQVAVVTTNQVTANSTNQTVAVATNIPAAGSSNAPAIAIAAGNAGNIPPAAAVKTNKPAWESSLSAGFSLTRGNSDTLLTTAAFKTHTKTPANEFMFGLDGAYGESDSVKNNEMLHGVSQYNHLFGERFYGYLNVEGLHDGIADLQYRFTIGPGVGYYFVKATNTTLAVELGPSLILQRLGEVDTTYASLRLAERFEHKLNNGARVWEKAEILPQANKLENFLVNAEIGAEALFTKTFSLRITVQDNFVNQPAPGRKDNDVKLISGLAYKF